MLEKTIPTTPLLLEDLGMIYATESSNRKSHFGIYRCRCGKAFKAQIRHIISGRIQSCGCYNVSSKTKHGFRYHRIYHIWNQIIQRTQNKNNFNYHYYGGRGINVCDRWNDISNFIDDMYPTFEEGLTIDRINNDGNYDPSNCRWATKSVQARNTRVLQSNNKSGYRGVFFDKKRNKWQTQIVINNKNIHIGRYNTCIEAAQAYNRYVVDNNLEHTINKIN